MSHIDHSLLGGFSYKLYTRQDQDDGHISLSKPGQEDKKCTKHNNSYRGQKSSVNRSVSFYCNTLSRNTIGLNLNIKGAKISEVLQTEQTFILDVFLYRFVI